MATKTTAVSRATAKIKALQLRLKKAEAELQAAIKKQAEKKTAVKKKPAKNSRPAKKSMKAQKGNVNNKASSAKRRGRPKKSS